MAAPEMPRRSEKYPRNQWYAVFPSASLGKRPRGIRRLGTEFVIWRDPDGKVACQDRICPHRGTDLALGKVTDGNLSCAYHGFEFRRDGRCMRIPILGDKKPPSNLRLGCFVSREENGLIWIWNGKPRRTYPQLPWLQDIPRDAPFAEYGAEWSAHFTRVMEGLIDLSHFPFLHRKMNPGIGPTLKSLELRKKNNQISMIARLENTTKKEKSKKGKVKLGLTLRYPNLVFGSMGQKIASVTIATPVDEKKTWVYHRYYQTFLIVPFLGKITAWIILNLERFLVHSRDRKVALRSLPRVSAGRYRPLLSDQGILAWHSWYRKSPKGRP